MKVLVTSRSFGNAGNEAFEILNQAGIEYTLMGSDYTDEKFEAVIADYDALIIGAHQFKPEDIRRCDKLKIVCKHGAGLDNIPLEVMKEQGITVTNVPAMNANAVADLTMGHILNVCRGISYTDALVRKGVWKIFIGRDAYNKTLGLVGFGAIAKNVARRAKGFSMKVLAYDPFVKEVPEEFKDFVTLVDFETMVKNSDFISIHVPLTKDTKDLFNKETILKMKKDAYLINMGRGGIINEKDLYEVMKDGHLMGAALDVIEKEPMSTEDPLLTLDNFVITPHIGMYSKESVGSVSIVCAENVASKLCGIGELKFVIQ